MALILLDGLEDTSSWTTNAGTAVIITGRTSNGLQVVSGQSTYFTIPAASENARAILGFAFRCTTMPGTDSPFMRWYSDAAATQHAGIFMTSTGEIKWLRAGTIDIGANTTGAGITANTWYYLEFDATLHDTAGAVTIRVNGVTKVSVSGVDTKQAGTKTTWDTVPQFTGQSALGTYTIDDLYIKTGAGDSFLGDITVETLYPNGNGGALSGLVLNEPFNDYTSAPWTTTGSPTLPAGRNGTCAHIAGGSQTAAYTIPAVSESDTVTIGFAARQTVMVANSVWLQFNSDAGATSHVQIRIAADGSLSVVRLPSGTLATSAAGLVVANTWFYLEAQVKLHDTTGSVIVRINGSEIINLTGVDTKNAGTKTTFDTIKLAGAAGTADDFDDLYLKTGAGATFVGDPWIGSDGDSVNNYALVAETTPNTTDYTKSSTVGAIDEYTLTDLSHTSGTIVAVCHQAMVALAAAGAQTFALVNRRSADTVGTTQTCSSTSYSPFHQVWTTDPETGAAWTVANVNALQTGIELGPPVDVLFEPFDNLYTAPWVGAGNVGLAAPNVLATGRNGSSVSFAVNSDWSLTYTIPAASESDMITVGVAFKAAAWGGGETHVLELRSDAAATLHDYVAIRNDGSMAFYLRGSSGTLTAAGAFTTGTWYYLEVQVYLHDTAGFYTMKLNGTTVLSATSVDTKNAGTKTTFDSVRVMSQNTGAQVDFDDLYVTMGPGSFKGSQAVASGTYPISGVGLRAWYDASNASSFTYSSSTVVSQWNDRSGLSRHVSQGTVASQPNRNGTQNGLSTVVFDGSDDNLAYGSSISTVVNNFTFFVACRRTGGNSSTVSIAFLNGDTGGANGYGLALRANSGNIGIYCGGVAWLSTATADPAAPGVYSVQRNAGTWGMWLNGTATNLSSTTAPTTPNNTQVANGGNFGGPIYEVIFYDRVLTTTERQSVESYLKTKWGTP